MAPKVLFNGKRDIYHVVQEQRDKLKREYEALPDDKSLDENVMRDLKNKYMLDVPTLRRDEWEADQGLNETVVYVPFDGDPNLFDIRPSQFDGQLAVGEISGKHLAVRVGNVAVEANAKRELDKVDSRLRSLRGSLEYLREQLNIEAAECAMRRRKSIEHKARTKEELTIPRRKPQTAVQPTRIPDVPTPVVKDQSVPKVAPQTWDIFMSHASPDKSYVRGLVKALRESNVTVWFDEDTADWGEPLRQAIKKGLSNSRYGIAVLSSAYIAVRKWCEHELDGLFSRERVGTFIILPIWHGIERDELEAYDPALADRLAKISENDSYPAIVEAVLKKLGRIPVDNKAPTANAASSNEGATVAHVIYYAPNGERPHMIVKRAVNKADWFILRYIDGSSKEGELSSIAIEYALADKRLLMSGFKHQAVSGGGEFPELNL